MALTSDQLKLVKKIISERLDESRNDVNFIIKCEDCTNEEIDLFDELCQNSQYKWSLGDRLWIKVKYSVIDEQYEITAGEYW